jgi:RHS repeat-associated protein
MQFEFDSSGSSGLDPNGDVETLTTSQATIKSYGLTPGNGSGSSAGTDTYSYDQLSRATADTQTGPSGTTQNTSEAYSDNGEPATENNAIGNTSISYPSSGNDPGSIKQVSSSGGTGFPWKYTTYDGNGNRVCENNSSACPYGAATVNMQYNGADKLTGVGSGRPASGCGSPSLPTALECLTYDGNGDVATLNFSETGGAFVDQTITWSTAGGGVPTPAVWTEDNNGTTTHTDFMYGPQGLPVEQINVNGSTETPDWYYQDPLRNTRVLLDTSANVDQSYNYDDYGNYSTGTTSSGPATPLLYKGTFTDTVDTGFVFMQTSWYDPETAQFISRDPMVNQTLQPYGFPGDNPTSDQKPTPRMFDPTPPPFKSPCSFGSQGPGGNSQRNGQLGEKGAVRKSHGEWWAWTLLQACWDGFGGETLAGVEQMNWIGCRSSAECPDHGAVWSSQTFGADGWYWKRIRHSGHFWHTNMGFIEISSNVKAEAENDNNVLPFHLPCPAGDTFAYLDNTLTNDRLPGWRNTSYTINMKAAGPCAKAMQRHYKVYESPWWVVQ